MSSDNVEYLPVWKKGASADERLQDLAMIARKHPERFVKMAVLYEEDIGDNKTRLRWVSNGFYNTNELIGVLEIAKNRIIDDTSER